MKTTPNARRITLAALLCAFLITVAPLTSAATLLPPISAEEWAETTHDPDPTWLPTENNLLVIAADTGETLSWEDRGTALTDIRIRGVEPDGAGFMLVNPNDVRVFFDKTATPDGDVTFWSMNLQAGLWTVLKTGSGSEPTLIVQFTPALDTAGIIDFLFGASYSTKPQAHGYRAPANCGPYTQQVEQRDLRSPLAVLHSPYRGSSTMTSGYASTTTAYFGPWGSSGTTSTSFTLDSTSGNTEAAFKWARWSLYMNGNSCQEWGGTKTYYTKAGYFYQGTEYMNIPGPDMRTDRDDAVEWSPGVRFDHRYNGATSYTSTGPTSSPTESTSNKAVTTFGGAVQFQRGYLSVNVGATSEQTQTYYYDYHFVPSGLWYWQNVRNAQQSRAFCYSTSGVSC